MQILFDCFLVLLEAMCSGVPIVSSKYADGAYDIIKEGLNGFIVDPYNSKKLAEAINNVLSDDGFKNRCVKINNNEKEKFKFSEIVKGY